MYFSKKDAQQITDASNNALRQRGTEPSNLKEDLLKLFRGLIGQKSIEEQLQEQPGVGTEFKITVSIRFN